MPQERLGLALELALRLRRDAAAVVAFLIYQQTRLRLNGTLYGSQSCGGCWSWGWVVQQRVEGATRETRALNARVISADLV